MHLKIGAQEGGMVSRCCWDKEKELMEDRLCKVLKVDILVETIISLKMKLDKLFQLQVLLYKVNDFAYIKANSPLQL